MIKILLAEDDLFLRDIYEEVLKSESYDVTVAKDGTEALEKFKDGGWDLVLLDVIMPGMSGVDVLQSLGSSSIHTLAHHIVFMTNIDEIKTLGQLLISTDGYILKSSVTPDQFVNKVKEILKI